MERMEELRRLTGPSAVRPLPGPLGTLFAAVNGPHVRPNLATLLTPRQARKHPLGIHH